MRDPRAETEIPNANPHFIPRLVKPTNYGPWRQHVSESKLVKADEICKPNPNLENCEYLEIMRLARAEFRQYRLQIMTHGAIK